MCIGLRDKRWAPSRSLGGDLLRQTLVVTFHSPIPTAVFYELAGYPVGYYHPSTAVPSS